MSTFVNEFGEFVEPEPGNPYAHVMRIDMERERERNLYRRERELRERIRRLHAGRRGR